jgi:hypothetical protein
MNHVFLHRRGLSPTRMFGESAASFTDPTGACRNAGVPFTLHSDAPCSPIGPLRLIQAAVTRRCVVDGSVVGADQAITVERALAAVTTQAARQIGLDHKIGSLEAGKEGAISPFLKKIPERSIPKRSWRSRSARPGWRATGCTAKSGASRPSARVACLGRRSRAFPARGSLT